MAKRCFAQKFFLVLFPQGGVLHYDFALQNQVLLQSFKKKYQIRWGRWPFSSSSHTGDMSRR